MPVSDHDAIFEAAAKEWNVHPHLLRAVAHQESGGKPRAVSRAGATGVMQIMPATGQELGVTDLTNPEQSIYAGAKYLSQMLDKYKRPELALAAYNAGPKRVDDYMAGRGQLPNETQAYVPAVTGHYRRMTQTVADRRDSGVMSDDDFLKAVGTGAKSGAMSDDEFLKAVGGAPALAAAPPADKRQQGTLDDPVMPQRFQKRATLGPRADAPVDVATVGAQPGELPIMQRLRNALAPNPDAGEILPLAGDATKGTLRPAVPNALLSLGRGALDLLEGPATGTVSPEATLALTMGIGGPGMSSVARGTGAKIAGNRLAMDSAREASLNSIADELAASIANDVQGPGRGKFLLDRITKEVQAVDAPKAPPVPPPVGAAVADARPVGARSVGAAASPEGASNMSRAEMQAQRATAERDRLLEPQPRGVDKNEYIPGVQTTEAQMVQSSPASRREKLLEMEMGEPFKQVAKANNEVRGAFYDELAGTPTQRRRLEEARTQQAEADLRATWSNKQPADASPVKETAAAILESPDGRRPAVRNAVDQVTKELVDSKGQPITDPELLYGVRKHIDDMLEARDGSGAKVNDRVRAQLQELKASLDGVIETAAPGFKDYLKNFSEASRPIDEMTVLQEFGPRIRDSQNRITYSSVQRMLKDIVDDRGGRGINPAQSISDETMNKLFALRDDLRRVASAEDLAKARGSDTAQNMLDMAKSVGGRVAGEAAGLAASGVPFVGSALWGGITSAIRQNKLKTDVTRAINPDRNKLGPPN